MVGMRDCRGLDLRLTLYALFDNGFRTVAEQTAFCGDKCTDVTLSLCNSR